MNYTPPKRSDGTYREFREKLPWPKDRPFRVLSLDGGGIRGLFGASYLAEIERRYLNGTSIGKYFDMVAGTSTGGIIALGLATGMTAAEVSKIYTERGEYIFPPAKVLTGWWRFIKSIRSPKHRTEDLRNELLRIFDHKVLDDVTCRVVVPCFEAEHGEPFIYKTPHHPIYQRDRHKPLVDIALHTAAAPSYLAAVENHGYKMVDGGIWANNPVMIAVVDVLANYDIALDNIRILSIGTGDETVKLAERHLKGGMFDWGFSLQAPLLFRMAATAQSQNAIGQAGLLVGRPNLVRVDLGAKEKQIALDDVKQAKDELPNAARSHAESNGQMIRDMFLTKEAGTYKSPAVQQGGLQ
ncbi:CBASS cGAMP-activated phospholipase [Ensifer adhaerens]|uniref:CBASS cGAMP-activated phospholipase n=1 Tax=Ensifer adhaerens TaxID=106592 RepID=UPI0008073122|nr:CBASS cGAMP-activated phospholipase [Ensifer adhaerens]